MTGANLVFRRLVIFFSLKISSTVVGEVCYPDVGCFSQCYPWFTLTRPFPPPHGPDVIQASMYLYTRSVPERFTVLPTGNISLNGSDYQPGRRTAFIIHGFVSNGNESWLSDLKDAYLQAEDANVFLVDWGAGANENEYPQVAANTRVVGALLARFILYLNDQGQGLDELHLLGHSLGAHVSGYAGKYVFNVTGIKIAKITGFDPAQPGFETEISSEVQLNKHDSMYLEVVHSDAKPFIPFCGLGYIFPIGHIDFYLNKGTLQPGCIQLPSLTNFTLLSLASLPIKFLSDLLTCSHRRSYQVYTRAIDPNTSCTFRGRRSLLPYPDILTYPTCGERNCLVMNLNTEQANLTGTFRVRTSGTDPYCPSSRLLW